MTQELQNKINAAFPNATTEQKALLQLLKGEGMSDAHLAKLSEAIGHAEDCVEHARKAMTSHKEAEGHMDAFHKSAKKACKAMKAMKGEGGEKKEPEDDGDEKALSVQIAEQAAGKGLEILVGELAKELRELKAQGLQKNTVVSLKS